MHEHAAHATSDLPVLLVEDSETDAKLVVRELIRSGLSPSWERVQNAAALREALRRRDWQLVISDSSVLQLGALQALALTKEILPAVPFIVVAGTITEEEAVQAMRAGAADYVTKENLRRLGPAVQRELRQSRPGASSESVSHRLLAAREAESRRIARALHDEFGQLLTALQLTLRSAQVQRGKALKQALSEALSLAKQASEQARDFSLELWPTILDDLGLPSALRWLAERQKRWYALAIELDLDPVGRLGAAVEVACFRLAQEALTNVARHAEARAVQIVLTALEGAIRLEVRDDGLGFDPRAASERSVAGESLGLVGMRERVALAGGRLEIDSGPGRGTVVRAHFSASREAMP
jgi:signal transduction histidine kinase